MINDHLLLAYLQRLYMHKHAQNYNAMVLAGWILVGVLRCAKGTSKALHKSRTTCDPPQNHLVQKPRPQNGGAN